MIDFLKGLGGLLVFIAIIYFSFSGNGSSSSGGGRYDDYDYSYTEDDPTYEVTSDNWDCTDDCSGHEAGYEWASDNGITDPYDCDGNSDSFIEGCEAYANEYRQDMEEQQDSYDEDQYDYGY